ncbi:hypothetical protein Tco_0267642 [Tanacetum coccineum]
MVLMIVIRTRCIVKTHSTLFSIKLNHVSVHGIDYMLEDLGHDGHRVMFYQFLKPCCDLDNGLIPLANDEDVMLLAMTKTSGKGQSSGKEQEPYVVTLEPGQSSAECNVGSSQFPKVESKNKPGDDTDEDNDDSPNSDYLVDEDNNVDEVDVENSRGNFTIQEVALVLEFQSLTRGNFQAKEI